MTNPVNVYAESTPNPSALKFVSSRMLLFEGSVDYNSALEAQTCPLAQGLFSFSGVKSVFISSNFITVTKEGEIDWYEISNILREYIRGFLMSGEKVFLSNPLVSSPAIEKPNDAGLTHSEAVEIPELENRILQLLEEYVSPAVAQDGGEIQFRSFRDGVVTVALRGSCSGCPSSTLTLKSGIENLLKSMMPEVKEVVAEAD
ncbi:MAG: NifU family protein [Arcticibacter sp.]